ncbi:MAG TPA: hypothetical protein VE011_04640 [Candidatus Dormibacteraeota bacterium]|nr:hypothetical protein [Candidatus Dormibacteraeota bacterium]
MEPSFIQRGLVWRSLAVVGIALSSCSTVVPTAAPETRVASTPAPTATATPGPSPSPTPLATAGNAPTSWTEVFDKGPAVLNDISAGANGLLAAGCLANAAGDCEQALLLGSRDGMTWTEARLAGAAHASIKRLRRIGDRIVAVGFVVDDERKEVRSIAWASADGVRWSSVPTASSMNTTLEDVIASPTGAIAIGGAARYASEGGGFVVWNVSADGTFGRPRDIEIAGRPQGVNGGIWAFDRFLAWGPCGPCPSGDSVRSTVLMSSVDGGAWKVLPPSTAFHGGSVTEVVDAGHRLVAVGFEGDSWPTSPRGWLSTDGVHWDVAQVPTDSASIESVAFDGKRFVALGEDTSDPSGGSSSPVAWVSNDGMAWTRLPPDDGLPALTGFRVIGRVEVAGRVCSAGTFYGDPRQSGPLAAIYCHDVAGGSSG